jgi:hypothetical protein
MQRDMFIPSPRNIVRKIISGGQTGADRAALDVAIELGISHGGWIPKGRRTEDGKLPARYHLRETRSRSYSERTRRNVRYADATLILTTNGRLRGGSALTAACAGAQLKPWLHMNLGPSGLPRKVLVDFLRGWLANVRPAVLNVAGPRASSDPKIYEAVRRLLREAFAPCD